MDVIKTPKKLIEVALPLDAINAAAAREKSIRHGHPSTLHLWWARRPLAAARAVIFAQMVNDPGYQQGGGFRYGVNKEKAALERERLFKIIEDLVKWENTNNEEVLEAARAEIRRSWRETCELNKNHPQAAELFNPDKLPGFHDPFAGGGAIPLEAQRLGLESYASDLNPVAVTINKAMIEIPPRFAGRAPVGPALPDDKQGKLTEDWSGAKGLAEDVRRYGAWMRTAAEEKIGHLYPKVQVTREMTAERTDLDDLVGKELTVIAWLWARTVKSPNPAFSHVDVPLVSTFILSSKPGKKVYVKPVIEGDRYFFTIHSGTPDAEAENGTKSQGRGANFRCLLSGAPIGGDYIKAEGQAGRMGVKMMAIVAEGVRGRVYLSPTREHEDIANIEFLGELDDFYFAKNSRHMTPWVYGLDSFGKLFTPRQMFSLSVLSKSVVDLIPVIRSDAVLHGFNDDGLGLDKGGCGALAYAQAVAVYLSMAIDRLAMTGNSLVRWNGVGEKAQHCFGRQALPMLWDFAEVNFMAESTGGLGPAVLYSCDSVSGLPAFPEGSVAQLDAKTQSMSENKVVSTDPPYYDNVPYGDLSDLFYMWMRKVLKEVYSSIFLTRFVPKSDELVADSFRHKTRDNAEVFFMNGMTASLGRIRDVAHSAFPVTVYYAFKQSETSKKEGTSSTGWETFLEALVGSGFMVTGTWPLHTEMKTRQRAMGSNALASSILLVVRPREKKAPIIGRREFIRELNICLAEAIFDMTRGGANSPVDPVDMSQAIIGPGMAVFSQYASVLEADGSPMRVRTALQLINRFVADDDFDHDTQFCLLWFEEQGWAKGKFGDADVLARAKGTSVSGLQASGVVASGKGELRLLKWAELPRDWSPENDNRLPVWEALHQLIRALNQEGESAAGALLARMPSKAEPARSLAYRLYTLCERKGWAEEARAYNELVTAWTAIEQAAAESGVVGSQAALDF